MIIDEAHLAFDRANLDEEQMRQAQADLALMTRLTKQERKVFFSSVSCSIICYPPSLSDECYLSIFRAFLSFQTEDDEFQQ